MHLVAGLGGKREMNDGSATAHIEADALGKVTRDAPKPITPTRMSILQGDE